MHGAREGFACQLYGQQVRCCKLKKKCYDHMDFDPDWRLAITKAVIQLTASPPVQRHDS